MAGYITLLGSFMMVMIGASSFYTGMNASNRTHLIPATQVPTFYTGLWNLSIFTIPLICSIFLIQKKHPKIAVVGIILQLIAGIIPLVATQILQNVHDASSILAAFPMLFASASALIFVAVSKKQN